MNLKCVALIATITFDRNYENGITHYIICSGLVLDDCLLAPHITYTFFF